MISGLFYIYSFIDYEIFKYIEQNCDIHEFRSIKTINEPNLYNQKPILA